jgi:hypothetical protein
MLPSKHIVAVINTHETMPCPGCILSLNWRRRGCHRPKAENPISNRDLLHSLPSEFIAIAHDIFALDYGSGLIYDFVLCLTCRAFERLPPGRERPFDCRVQLISHTSRCGSYLSEGDSICLSLLNHESCRCALLDEWEEQRIAFQSDFHAIVFEFEVCKILMTSRHLESTHDLSLSICDKTDPRGLGLLNGRRSPIHLELELSLIADRLPFLQEIRGA